MPRHLAFLLAAAALAALCAAAAPPEPAAAAAFVARRALRDSQAGCGDCKPDYSITVASKGGCTIPFCLWYADRRNPSGKSGCWDARPDKTTLAAGDSISLDTSYQVNYLTGGKEADASSPQLNYTPISGFCWDTCQVPLGYEAYFNC